jgi:hypothetical protein
MATSKFEQALANIIEEAHNEPIEKVASVDERIEALNGDVAKSLTKVASVLREVSTEPTYQDILDFIGE